MRKIAVILAVAVIMMASLAGAVIPSVTAYADETVYTELRYQVNASEDDASYKWCDGIHHGFLDTTSSTVYIGVSSDYCGDFAGYSSGGLVFSSVNVPNSSEATILNAYIGVYLTENDGGLFIDIYGEDDATVQNYVDNPTLEGRNKTVAYSHHENTELGTAWWYVDVTPVVRELIASPNWSQGNNMSFIWNYVAIEGGYNFQLESYDGDPELAPKLVINYAPTWENHYVITYNGLTDAVVGANYESAESCEDYHVLNANESGVYIPSAELYEVYTFTLFTTNTFSSPDYIIARSVTRFNTSVIPDDAYVTGGAISLTGRATFGENTSLVVTGYTYDEVWPVDELISGESYPFFNREYFTKEYASFYTGEYRYGEEAWVYATEPFDEDIGDYINKTGYTNFGFRDINDINDVCPDEVAQIYVYGWVPNLNVSYEHLIPSFMTLDTGEEPIIPSDSPVSSMMVILGLVFSAMGVLGILGVLLKGENLAIPVRAGLLMGFTLFFIIGVVIIQGIIVSVT